MRVLERNECTHLQPGHDPPDASQNAMSATASTDDDDACVAKQNRGHVTCNGSALPLARSLSRSVSPTVCLAGQSGSRASRSDTPECGTRPTDWLCGEARPGQARPGDAMRAAPVVQSRWYLPILQVGDGGRALCARDGRPAPKPSSVVRDDSPRPCRRYLPGAPACVPARVTTRHKFCSLLYSPRRRNRAGVRVPKPCESRPDSTPPLASTSFSFSFLFKNFRCLGWVNFLVKGGQACVLPLRSL